METTVLSRYYSSLTIAKKLALLTLSAVAGIEALTAIFLLSERNLILKERESTVRQAVEETSGILDYHNALAVNGTLPEAEAKQKAMVTIKGLRNGRSEYFCINDMHPTMIMHPIK